MDAEIGRFLKVLADSPLGEVVVSSPWLPCCTRKQDKARSAAKRLGFAVCARKPMRWVITDAIRFRSKREDFPSKEAQRVATELSAHIIMQMRDVAANTFAMMEHIGQQLTDKLGMEHTPNADFDPERDQ